MEVILYYYYHNIYKLLIVVQEISDDIFAYQCNLVAPIPVTVVQKITEDALPDHSLLVAPKPIVDATRFLNQKKLAEQLTKISLEELDCCGGCQQETLCVGPLCILCCHPFHDKCKSGSDTCRKCQPIPSKYITNNFRRVH
jgi:hypothetical protein